MTPRKKRPGPRFGYHFTFHGTIEIQRAIELYLTVAKGAGLESRVPDQGEALRALVLMGRVKLLEVLEAKKYGKEV